MEAEEQARKLAQIAELPSDQLAGWEAYVLANRQFFDGEQAAILRRRKELNIKPNTNARRTK